MDFSKVTELIAVSQIIRFNKIDDALNSVICKICLTVHSKYLYNV